MKMAAETMLRLGSFLAYLGKLHIIHYSSAHFLHPPFISLGPGRKVSKGMERVHFQSMLNINGNILYCYSLSYHIFVCFPGKGNNFQTSGKKINPWKKQPCALGGWIYCEWSQWLQCTGGLNILENYLGKGARNCFLGIHTCADCSVVSVGWSMSSSELQPELWTAVPLEELAEHSHEGGKT